MTRDSRTSFHRATAALSAVLAGALPTPATAGGGAPAAALAATASDAKCAAHTPLRGYLTVTAVSSGQATLYHGKCAAASAPPAPPAPPIDNEYSVDRDADIVVHFDSKISDLHGSVSVRARVLGSPPTEIPVENYTVVNEKELKEERKLLFPDDSAFYRGDDHRLLLNSLATLKTATTEYGALLDKTATTAMASRSSAPTTTDAWWNDTRRQFRGSEALAAVRAAISPDSQARLKSVKDGLELVRSNIDSLFLSAKLPLQLDDESLGNVRREALTLEADLANWKATLDIASATDADALAICNKTSQGFLVTKPITASKTADKSTLKQVLNTQDFFRIDQETKKIIFPPELDGFDVALDTAAVVAVTSRERDDGCDSVALPSVLARLALQHQVISHLNRTIIGSPTDAHADALAGGATAAPDAPPAGKDTPDNAAPAHDIATPKSNPPASLLTRIEMMKKQIRDGIQIRLESQLRDARVRLSQASLAHNDRVEITVRVTRQGTAILATDEPGTVDIEERVVLRAVQRGISFSVSPQFAMIKRFSDVRVATPSEVPSNFKPAAGVAFAMRWRSLHRRDDWLIPSVGISAHLVDFDPTQPIEVGAGPSIGLLDEHIHAGVGWNLAVEHDRMYLWLSLDFLRTSETFAGLFGGVK